MTNESSFGYPDYANDRVEMKLTMARLEKQKRIQKQYRNLFSSVILGEDTFALLREYCLHKGQTYPEGVHSAVSHCLHCDNYYNNIVEESNKKNKN
jgi:hypothetical protein